MLHYSQHLQSSFSKQKDSNPNLTTNIPTKVRQKCKKVL